MRKSISIQFYVKSEFKEAEIILNNTILDND